MIKLTEQTLKFANWNRLNGIWRSYHWMITLTVIIISRFHYIYQKGDRRCDFDSHRFRRRNSAGQTDASKNDVFGSTETIMDSDDFCLKQIMRSYLFISETIRAKFIRELWCWSFSFSNANLVVKNYLRIVSSAVLKVAFLSKFSDYSEVSQKSRLINTGHADWVKFLQIVFGLNKFEFIL